ncbi:MAG: DNA polymerase III subunit alpha [Muribaculaceae bacterium]|nr:DNA polymerase III subunit alpha [Muribaculaceae bacterium]
MQKFVHLHVHSQFSTLDGLSTIGGIIKKAVADGMPAVALTDHGNMFGAKDFFNAIEKHNGSVKKAVKKAKEALAAAEAEGDADAIAAARAEVEKEQSRHLKPIIGCEMYVARGDMHDKSDRTDRGYHLVVLAKNRTGYKNLIRLVSKAWTEGYYTHPRTDRTELEAHREGLIVCSACLGGEVPKKLTAGDLEAADEAVRWYHRVFGDDYYLELQRHKATVPRANHEAYTLQRAIEPQLIELARKYNIKLVATNDSHFLNESDAEAHDRLICLSTGKYVTDEDRMLYSKQEWFKTTAEMEQVFSDIPEALTNTLEIADKVEEYDINHAPIMPFFAIPADFGTEEEYRQRITEEQLYDEFTQDENGNVVLSREEGEKKIEKLGGYEKLYRIKFEADYLRKIAYEGAARRYGLPLSEEVEERVNFELHIMKTMGFPGYFLIVEDFIRTGRSMGVSIGPGRGSAAGSVVAYCLGITQIDPLRYDLLFERFLNPDRISLPDIDVDFDDDGRETVLNYVTERYGAPNVAHIITYGTMAAKSAIRDVARVMSVPMPISTRLTKLVPRHMPIDPADENKEKELKCTVSNLINYVPEFKQEMDSDPSVRELMNYAAKLEGTVRNIGVHACGVIICRDDVSDWVPVSTAADKNGERILVTQYDGHVIEETGLIKMDFLGLKTLSIIKEALANIRRSQGIEVDIDNIPIDDPKTYELYSRGATVGTFQFESPGMQRYLRQLRPSVFEDLIAMNALYRPGPMDNIPEFIARKHGEKKIEYDIPEMEVYLKDTYGITVYQEQVMLLSRLLAGFTRGQSDTLRKAMGKKQIAKMNELKEKFFEGGSARGHKVEVLAKIWTEWEKFASYAFNKSHATCYSWVAFQTGYLKANYPAEFMAAVLSRNLNDITKLSFYMDECRTMGIDVKGPDINASMSTFSVAEPGVIRFGLTAIKGIGPDVVRAIIDEREKNGPYADIYDFVERVPTQSINRRVFDNLVLAGAFDCFTGVKREDLSGEVGKKGESVAEQLLRYGASRQNQKDDGMGSLFGFDDENIRENSRPRIQSMPLWDNLVRLNRERDLVGMYLSAHPLDPYWLEIKYGMTMTCADKNECDQVTPQGGYVSFGGLVSSVEERTFPRGTMTILKVEDYTGTAEVTIFEKQRAEFDRLCRVGTPVCVVGAFQERENKRTNSMEIRFNPTRIMHLDELKGHMTEDITITVEPEQFMSLREILNEECPLDNTGKRKLAPGGVPVYIQIYSEKYHKSFTHSTALNTKLSRQFLHNLDEEGFSYKIKARRAKAK